MSSPITSNLMADTGADAAANLIREFLLKGITTHVPQGANGQPIKLNHRRGQSPVICIGGDERRVMMELSMSHLVEVSLG